MEGHYVQRVHGMYNFYDKHEQVANDKSDIL